MQMTSRAYAILGVAILLAVLLPIALNARSLLVGACASPFVHAVLGTSIFGDICPVPVPDPTLPLDTQQPTAGAGAGLSSGSRGISCPKTAVAGSSVAISWSCGSAATLSAVAGFALADRTKTSAVVVPTASSSVYGIRCSDGYESMCSINASEGEIRIVADPASVRLGSRTNIFWNSQNTASCQVRGPSFSESGTNGGASTVPITVPSTFTAVCTTISGGTVSAKVTVDIAQ